MFDCPFLLGHYSIAAFVIELKEQVRREDIRNSPHLDEIIEQLIKVPSPSYEACLQRGQPGEKVCLENVSIL